MKVAKQVTAEQESVRSARQSGVLDQANAALKLSSNGQLARALNLQPSVISKLRSGKIPVSSSQLIAIHELMENRGVAGWSIRQIKAKLGIKRLGDPE